MAEIGRVAGSQLDPAIIKVFEQVCAAEPDWIARFNIARDLPQAAPAPAAA